MTRKRHRDILLVEVVTDISTTDIKVDIPSTVDAEAVEDTNACSQFIGVATRRRSTLESRSEAKTSIRDQRVEAIFVVTADHLRKVEEHVSVSVDVLLFGFIERITYVSVLVDLTSVRSGIPIRDEATIVTAIEVRGNSEVVTRPTRYTLNLIAISTKTDTNTWSKPLTEVSFEVRGDTVNKAHLLVVVTKIHLCTSTNTSEPVSAEAIRFYTILISILHLYRVHGVGRLLSTQCRSQ